MRIAVIGAGSAGLAALRHCSELKDQNGSPINVVCYEKTDKVGGTWVYTPEVGVDRFGLPIHSSMYKNLRYYYKQQSIRRFFNKKKNRKL